MTKQNLSHDNGDSRADAIAAISLIFLVVAFAVSMLLAQ